MRPEELAGWEELLQNPERRGEAARVLSREHRARGGEKLAVALEALAVATRDPGEEALVLADLGRVRLSMGDGEQAALAFARAIHLAPADASTLLAGLGGFADRSLAADVLADLRSDAPQAALAAIDRELSALG